MTATLIRKGYAGFATGDMTTLLAADVVWTVASQSPLARTCTGKAYVFWKFFAGLGNAAAEACRSRSEP